MEGEDQIEATPAPEQNGNDEPHHEAAAAPHVESETPAATLHQSDLSSSDVGASLSDLSLTESSNDDALSSSSSSSASSSAQHDDEPKTPVKTKPSKPTASSEPRRPTTSRSPLKSPVSKTPSRAPRPSSEASPASSVPLSADCTFSPLISPGSQKIARPGGKSVYDSLYEDAIAKAEKLKQKKAEREKALESAERRPQVSELAATKIKGRDVYDTLYNDAMERDKRLKQKREEFARK